MSASNCPESVSGLIGDVVQYVVCQNASPSPPAPWECIAPPTLPSLRPALAVLRPFHGFHLPQTAK